MPVASQATLPGFARFRENQTWRTHGVVFATLHTVGSNDNRGRSEARARLKRFVRLMPQLLAQQEKVLTRADLRYTNGFALSWTPAPKPDPVDPSVSPTAPAQPGGSTTQQGQT